jgi:hypothetical protein
LERRRMGGENGVRNHFGEEENGVKRRRMVSGKEGRRMVGEENGVRRRMVSGCTAKQGWQVNSAEDTTRQT